MTYTPMKVSVIIPIYNVKSFIGRCATTLMQQTLDEVEYIFVNDATPDESMDVLKSTLQQYPERLQQVKILTHEINKGLPEARNTGLKIATGKYIYHCDSDDFMEPDTLKQLYETAERENADYVWCDYFIVQENENIQKRQPDYANAEQALKRVLCGDMVYNVWNKLVCKKSFSALQETMQSMDKRLATVEAHAEADYKNILQIQIMSEEMPLEVRLEAGEKYVAQGWNGAIKAKYDLLKDEYRRREMEGT